ncbi:MAG TPA: type II toxin-antitoxin system Phd/YefM family antitoxin [Candidatus Dormibacteraeota bacterium]
MVVHWQLQEAKQRFSEVVRQAEADGPQVVTRHGHEVVVILSADEYRRLQAGRSDFKEFLLAAPDLDELDIRRSDDLPRHIELDD